MRKKKIIKYLQENLYLEFHKDENNRILTLLLEDEPISSVNLDLTVSENKKEDKYRTSKKERV
jgi:hypothetical protein